MPRIDKQEEGGHEEGFESGPTALMLALAAVAAGVLSAGSSCARQTQRTIGLITQQSADQFFGAVKTHPNGKGENR